MLAATQLEREPKPMGQARRQQQAGGGGGGRRSSRDERKAEGRKGEAELQACAAQPKV